MGVTGGGGPGPVYPMLQYQGRLTNPSTGQPVTDGTYAMTFNLYTDSAGSVVWTETKNVSVANGQFSALIGDVTSLPQSLLNGQELWLGIKVGADAEMTPRQIILPVAYAMSLRPGAIISGSLYNAPILQLTNTDSSAGGGNAISAVNYSSNVWRPAIYGENRGASAGIYGRADGWHAVVGWNQSNNYAGVWGYNAGNGYGVRGESTLGSGGYFTSTGSYGVRGETASTAAGQAGIVGAAGWSATTFNRVAGVLGQTVNGYGVAGASTNYYAVVGLSNNSDGVRGEALGTGAGVSGGAWGSGPAISGFNYGTGSALYLSNSSASTSDAFALYNYGTSRGAYFYNSSANGGDAFVFDGAGTGYTLNAYSSSSGAALYASKTGGGNYAGYFYGNVYVNGTLSKAGGSFKIDHPLDPANKYLEHSFVESPDMMNVYNGNITTDANGDATVTLPDYFEALNRDYRYQLTVIGQFAQAIVKDEIKDNRFTIKTDKPNVKVSWQVTGIRQDAWANANRIPVEDAKPANERGTYLYPQGYSQPESSGLDYAKSQAGRSTMSVQTVPMTQTGVGQ